MIAEEAAPVENLDAAAARDVLSKAQSQLSSASSDRVSWNSRNFEEICTIFLFSGKSRSSDCCRSRRSPC